MADQEEIIYIHGITPAPVPGGHKQDYDGFHSLLKDAMADRGKSPPAHRIDLEWGYPGPDITTNDRLLAPVERYLYQKEDEIADKHWDATINPLRMVYNVIRKNFLLGFCDMFYYISEDGKAEVRRNVLRTILRSLPPLPDSNHFEFTIISHSAGTVIMHDLLYIIFGGPSQDHLDDPADQALLARVKAYAAQERLFVRLFVTMGSPITPMMVRSNSLLAKIDNNGAKNGTIDLEGIGIRAHPTVTSKWLNFWDKDDVIAYPVEFLYRNPEGLLEDVYVDIGDSFPDVHSAYWGAEEVVGVVVERY